MRASMHDDLALIRYVDDTGHPDTDQSPMVRQLWQQALESASSNADYAQDDMTSEPDTEEIFGVWYRLSEKARRHYESVCDAGRDDLIPDVLERDDVTEWSWEVEFDFHLADVMAEQRRDSEVLAAYHAAKDRQRRWEAGTYEYV